MVFNYFTMVINKLNYFAGVKGNLNNCPQTNNLNKASNESRRE